LGKYSVIGYWRLAIFINLSLTSKSDRLDPSMNLLLATLDRSFAV
jgi:hypothetical protein